MTTAPAKNSTWPPAPNVLKLANCDDVAQIWTWYQISGSLGELKMDKEIIQYIFHGLEGYLTQEGLSRPSDDDVLAWISTAAVRDFIDKLALGDSVINSSLGNIVLRSKTKCWLPVCRVQRWDGNPDIAGVGMLVTYILQTFLVTVYLIALIMMRFDWTPTKMRNLTPMKRTLLAIQHSTGAFLSASFLFSISMLFASLLSEVDEDSNAKSTTWALLLIMPVGSTLPVVLLQLAAPETLRRARGRMALWFIVFTLSLTLFVLTFFGGGGEGGNSRFRLEVSDWERRCVGLTYLFPMVYLSLAIDGVLCVGVGIYIIRSAMASMRRHGTRKPVHLSRLAWWIMIIFAFGAMWTLIGWFIHFTSLLRDRARNTNRDAKWSFGQILALATWVPFVVEFVYIWWEEPEEALNGRLMDPYEIVKVAGKSGNFELEQIGGDEVSASLIHRATV